MDGKEVKKKSIIDFLRDELKAHEITHEHIALETVKRELNCGRGYNVQKIKDVMSGRVPLQGDIIETMVAMVEESMRERERLYEGDLLAVSSRLTKIRKRRMALDGQISVA